MQQQKFNTVDEYFGSLEGETLCKMEFLRSVIREAAPDATEVISYNMPAFRTKKILVYYAAHKEHIGFYPAYTDVMILFREQLRGFETSKGAIRFPLSAEIPADLVRKIIFYRLEVMERKR